MYFGQLWQKVQVLSVGLLWVALVVDLALSKYVQDNVADEMSLQKLDSYAYQPYIFLKHTFVGNNPYTHLITENNVLYSCVKISLLSSSSKHML